MSKEIYVTKRNGKRELFQLQKWQAQIAKVCEGVADVSPSMIEIAASPHFYNGMSTLELDQIALRAMVGLIDEEANTLGNVNYQHVAGKQRVSMLRKDVFGQYEPPHLFEIVKKNISLGLYTSDLLTWYSEEDWAYLNKQLDHGKDELLTYAAVEQLVDKYLVRNRATGNIVETPQIRYMIAAATAFHAEEKDRLKWAKDFYHAASDGIFTLATPVLAGLGTKTKQFSSCVLLRTDDTLKSIFATGQIMADYASKRAGIGLEIGRMRPLGSSIRGGEVMHTGILPFLKKWYGDLRSCCLRPDMYVEVMNGADTKRIKMSEVKVGMKIKTMTETNEIGFRDITDKFATLVKPEDQVRLEFENGTVINCSTNHPILVLSASGQVQVKPMDLTFEDEILTDSGLTKLKFRDLGQNNDPSYLDITVEDTHVFFTSETENGPMVLTHNSQGGIRNASATVNMPIWHYQFDDYIVLKNNKGTEETRVRQLDYCVVLNSFFWRRFKEQKNITFFDPNQVPDLYEAFYADSVKFEKMYVQYEQRKDLSKKVVPAETVFKEWLITERMETGRIYILNIDNVSNQGPFDTNATPIYQTNLCCLVGETSLMGTVNGLDCVFTLEEAVSLFLSGEKVQVMSKNLDTGELQYKPVSAALKTGVNRKVLKITDSASGKSIICTPDHRVFTKNRGWVRADSLTSVDNLEMR